MLRVWLSTDEAALRHGRSLITPGLVGSTPPVDQYNRIATDDPGSWPWGSAATSAGPASISVPCSMAMCRMPLAWYWKWGVSHSSVPAIGLM